MSARNEIEDGIERLVQFIVRRENVRLRKTRGETPPWTDDEILQTYRFCNIHREDDATTRWIARCWRTPNKDMPDLWLLMTMARLLNDVNTLTEITPHLTSDDYEVLEVIRGVVRLRQERGARVFNPAYMITTAGKKQDKVDYVFDLLKTLCADRENLRPKEGETLNSYHMLLGQWRGLGSFLAGQVVADLKYADPHLQKATDWHTFAASGPGSRRGMNRILGRAPRQSWREDDWRLHLSKLRTWTAPILRRHKIVLHAQDLQNCLCEFDKYERARLGEGRPKQRYVHHDA